MYQVYMVFFSVRKLSNIIFKIGIYLPAELLDISEDLIK